MAGKHSNCASKSRRSFLKWAGLGLPVIGATVLSGAGNLAPAGAKTTHPITDLPYPYKKLDPDQVAERAYKNIIGGKG